MPSRPADERRWRELGNDLLAELRGLNTALLRIQEQIRAIRDQQEAINEHQQQKLQQPPIFQAELQVPEAVQRQKRTSDNHQFAVQVALTVVTFLAFVAAAIYAGVAYRQWGEMRRSAKAAEDAVVIAKRTAETSLDATINQFHLEQRAWLGVVSAEPPDLRPKPDFFITLHVTNSGRSPALNFYSETVMRSLGKDAIFTPIYGPVVGGIGRGVIEPGEVISIQSNRYPITQAQIDWVKNGRYILYVYGKMSYDDVFKATHHTTFCREVLSESQIRDCNTYNSAD